MTNALKNPANALSHQTKESGAELPGSRTLRSFHGSMIPGRNRPTKIRLFLFVSGRKSIETFGKNSHEIHPELYTWKQARTVRIRQHLSESTDA